MINIIEHLAHPGTAPRPGTKLRAFRGVTIHDTGNTSPTATAMAHAELLRGAWKGVDTSWHYAVDDHDAVRCIPEDEISWHAGDGAKGPGNNETISIETCINQGGYYEATIGNTAELAADILFRHGVRDADGYLFQHHDWSGKDCPHLIRSMGIWENIKHAVQMYLDEFWIPEPTEEQKYTIKPGDTLWGISKRLNIPLRDILNANPDVDPFQLRNGQVILLTKLVAPLYYTDHTIVQGDTFCGLSRKYGTTLGEIKTSNPGVDPYQLEIGQVVKIPK